MTKNLECASVILGIFVTMVLGIIFGRKGDKGSGGHYHRPREIWEDYGYFCDQPGPDGKKLDE